MIPFISVVTFLLGIILGCETISTDRQHTPMSGYSQEEIETRQPGLSYGLADSDLDLTTLIGSDAATYGIPIGKKELETFPHLLGMGDHMLLGNRKFQVVLAGIPLSPPGVPWVPAILGAFAFDGERWQSLSQHFQLLLSQKDDQGRYFYPIALDSGTIDDGQWGFVTFIFATQEGASRRETLTWYVSAQRPVISLVVDRSNSASVKQKQGRWHLKIADEKMRSIRVEKSKAPFSKSSYHQYFKGSSVYGIYPYSGFTERQEEGGDFFEIVDRPKGLEGFELTFGNEEAIDTVNRGASLGQCLLSLEEGATGLNDRSDDEGFLTLNRCMQNLEFDSMTIQNAFEWQGASPWFLVDDGDQKLSRILIPYKSTLTIPVPRGKNIYLAKHGSKYLLQPETSLPDQVIGEFQINKVASINPDLPWILKVDDLDLGPVDPIIKEPERSVVTKLAEGVFSFRRFPISFTLPEGKYRMSLTQWGAGEVCGFTEEVRRKGQRKILACGSTLNMTHQELVKNGQTWEDAAASLGQELTGVKSGFARLKKSRLKTHEADVTYFIDVLDPLSGVGLRLFPATPAILEQWYRYEGKETQNDLLRFAQFAKTLVPSLSLEMSCPPRMPIYDLSRYLLLLKPDFFRGIDCGGKSFQQDIWRLWQKGLIGKSVVLTPAQLPDSSTDYERMAILILSGQAKGLEKSQITIPFNFSRGGILRADPLQWIGSSARGQREASLQITFKTNQHASPLKLRIHGSAQKNHELVLQSNTLGVETVEGAYQAFQTTLPVAHDTHWLKLELFDDNGTLAESYLPVVQ